MPGARVSEVARRWQVCSQQVFGWRRAMRQDLPGVVGTTTTVATPVSFRLSEVIPTAAVQSAASAVAGIALTSNIRLVQIPLPQANQALRRSPLNQGVRGPLTTRRLWR